jgi:putative transcriptional regulator
MSTSPEESRIDEQAREQLRRLRNGCLLLSREELLDPNFSSTVVLICVHNADGAYGLVLNRPAHMPLSEVFDIEMVERSERRKIYMGGPVRQETLQLLQRTGSPVSGAFEVAPNVHLGGDWGSLDQILSADEENTRLFLGYSGWGAGQLESEVTHGAWEVYTADLERLLDEPEDHLQGSVEKIRSCLRSLGSTSA